VIPVIKRSEIVLNVADVKKRKIRKATRRCR